MKALVTGAAGFIGSHLENLADVATRPGRQFARGDICDPAPFVTTNVLGTQVLLDAALRHQVAKS